MTRSGPRYGCQIALQQTIERLLDYLVSEREQLWRHCNTQCLRRLEIDDKLKLGWLLHRKLGRLGAFQNAVDIEGCLADTRPLFVPRLAWLDRASRMTGGSGMA
jgi:hypothetical protein